MSPSKNQLKEMCSRVARSLMGISVLTFERTRLYSLQHPEETLIEPKLASATNGSRFHWPEYLMEAAEVALYMFLTCFFAGLLLSPTSPVRHVLRRPIE